MVHVDNFTWNNRLNKSSISYVIGIEELRIGTMYWTM